jgi:hypothetical protein
MAPIEKSRDMGGASVLGGHPRWVETTINQAMVLAVGWTLENMSAPTNLLLNTRGLSNQKGQTFS